MTHLFTTFKRNNRLFYLLHLFQQRREHDLGGLKVLLGGGVLVAHERQRLGRRLVALRHDVLEALQLRWGPVELLHIEAYLDLVEGLLEDAVLLGTRVRRVRKGLPRELDVLKVLGDGVVVEPGGVEVFDDGLDLVIVPGLLRVILVQALLAVEAKGFLRFSNCSVHLLDVDAHLLVVLGEVERVWFVHVPAGAALVGLRVAR
mmetsp:Transcript_10578/g.29885  ORF Transcript_10578/g.29885 Transcript_10578/m.29885 type:complete len:203 (-) Transcript_10578:110-718(-)